MPASQTVALVLTDVQGSTRLWRDAPEAMNASMARHHALVAATVATYGGWRPVDQGEGDATFLAFDSPTAAVAAALNLQRAFVAEAWPTPVPLAVRIGIHVGEVIVRDGNLFGETVSRCARIRGIGHGGQTLLSTAAYELVRDALPDRASVRSLGAHQMKDLIRPEVVWQLDHPDLASDFPPLSSLDRVRHNLPMQLTSFVGREAEVADLTRLLREGTRLVTVTGFGGMGKTRLSLAVAADLVDGTGDGVWFVDLSGIADADSVPREIANVLGARDTGRGMADAVLEHMAGKRLLLVLDNLEQILGCAPFVARLLAEMPGVSVLGTSREPLGLRGEAVYGLNPFPSPDMQSFEPRAGAQPVSTYAAVSLFIDRAQDARRDFRIDEDNAAAVAAICVRLDGVPLAIELAAARVAMLTPAALLARLEQSLGVLSGGELDRPERHRTVRATVAWSYDLLTPVEQTLLARLSVFPGTAGLDAVEALCAELPGDTELDVFPLLASLVDKSLVRRSEQDGEPRFSLLVSIRDFATEQLTPRARLALADAHLTHYLAKSVTGAATADGPDELPWYDEMYRDAHNFRGALAHAESTGQAYEHLLLAANLLELWQLGGHLVEGRCHLAQARRAAGDLPADLTLAAFATCAETWLTDVALGQTTIALARRGVELADRSADLAVTAFAYQALGSTVPDRFTMRGAYERAVDLAGAARAAASPIRWGITRPDAVEIAAAIELVLIDRWDEPQRAVARLRSLRERAVEARRDGDVATVDLYLGEAAADAGEVSVALPLFDRAIKAFERRHHDYWLSQGVLARARTRVRAGLDPTKDLAPLIARYHAVTPRAVATAEVLLGDLRAGTGDLAAAAAAYRRAVVLSPSARDPEPGWRLLRFDRLAGRDTRDDLEALFQRKRASLWPRPDVLGCLVEAAATAEQHDRPDVAALLIATVTGMRRNFLLPEVILADLSELEQRYQQIPRRSDLPNTLFG